MPDREKVIKGLKCCSAMSGDECCKCPYSSECLGVNCPVGMPHLANDALELLKEQEPRILDFDELEDWDNAVWFEEKDERDCYIALTANVGTDDAKFVNVEPGNFHRLDFLREFYKKEWRCWSALPTVKQRQAVKWDA